MSKKPKFSKLKNAFEMDWPTNKPTDQWKNEPMSQPTNKSTDIYVEKQKIDTLKSFDCESSEF